MTDSRWREVFLLPASLLSEGNTDDFFQQLRAAIDRLIIGEPTLLELLAWSEERTLAALPSDERRTAVRLAYIFLARARALVTTSQVGFDYGLYYAGSYAEIFASDPLDRTDKEWQALMADMPQLVAGIVELAQTAGLTVVAQALRAQTIPTLKASPLAWQHYATALKTLMQQRNLRMDWELTNV